MSCVYYEQCDSQWKSQSSLTINGVDVCFNAWNVASKEEQRRFAEAVKPAESCRLSECILGGLSSDTGNTSS